MTTSTPLLLLRVGIAFAFIYPPLSAIIDPYAWVGYFPPFVSVLPVDPMLLLHIFGAIEVLLALWILFGKRIQVPLYLAALFLMLIVVFNLPQIDVLFRDIPIIFMILALVHLSRRNT